mmetsp:Transcript_20692/g.73099  ORF Transcript_20692/g.73099 Transcript_20692/m.73099 type:complete len:166 (-) Transcript_20692:2266-2763(-)
MSARSGASTAMGASLRRESVIGKPPARSVLAMKRNGVEPPKRLPASKPRPYNRYSHFERLRKAQEAKPGGTFFSVVVDGLPYKSEEERRREEEKEGKKLWVGGQFNAAIGKRTTTLKPVVPIVNTGPYEDARNRFREEDRDRFIDPKGFVLDGAKILNKQTQPRR